MTHALRRVSFSTCLPSLFAFAARDPGQALNKQFCHVFHTSQVSADGETTAISTKSQEVASLTPLIGGRVL